MNYDEKPYCISSGVKEIAYQDTVHYQITKAFLHHPQKMLASLFAAEVS